MKYGLIGKTLSHSHSKKLHEFLGNNEYELKEIPPDGIESFLRNAAFKGINVTIPYKETVMPYCIHDDTAKKIGSVNTIVNKNGKLYGFNTDYAGFLFMANNANISFNNKKVLILGNGGTCKTVFCAAKDNNAGKIVIVSRNGENNYENISRHADSDIIINTTPVGMFPNNGMSPLSLRSFKKLSAVIDVIYNPLRTNLLLEAKELDINTANGLSMLAAQALYAHNLFFNIKPDESGDNKKIAELLSKAEKHFSNIALVGMPGCGKTTIGKELAAVLAKDFIDTDLAIEESTGRKVSDIITEDGEPFFRDLEKKTLAEEAAKTNRVIATGGGSVLMKENITALLQNSVIIFLERELASLAVKDRPLSADLQTMYRQRLPIYKNICNHKIEVCGSLQENVQKIIEKIKPI